MTAQTLAPPGSLPLGLPQPEAVTAPELRRGLAALGLRPSGAGEALRPVLELLAERTAAPGVGYFAVPTGSRGSAAQDGGAWPLVAALNAADGGALAFEDTRRSAHAAALAPRGVLALLAAPVRGARGHLTGALLAYSGAARTWTPGDRQLLGAAAEVLALLAAPQGAEREAAHPAALRALGVLLEARDAETRGHTERVTRLALRLGQAMGLGAAELRALHWGASLHDIGKISLPDALLRHPGALDAPGRARMQQHVSEGTRLAGLLPGVPGAALAVIAAHHEQWDGGGYPRGLAAEAIPLAARILTACDVYDALTSVRPYKRAWTHAEAAAHLARCSGTHFDPAVVGALLRLLEEEVTARSA
ncbi:HD-GYP domain-containing protein [Deinococcus budaensis]|uniref:HD-GYP domain-containing protein (C-di-GMP phosphodiesterase class II) n=1 Tax=Deinococcus budaensis TaxID=1665626 RepID=A0A7W8LPF8_9DEIO|nr:HD-GYP domain-containing protein [Deinococcus budaensis]MBB5233733.1 HD-GYP domain-containing protein (c-di-GMP phosphodiesterase class II) [Deinococcus budaensis]